MDANKNSDLKSMEDITQEQQMLVLAAFQPVLNPIIKKINHNIRKTVSKYSHATYLPLS